MKKQLLLVMLTLGALSPLQAQNKVAIVCGSPAHQEKFEYLMDLIGHDKLTPEQKARYQDKVKQLVWGVASLFVKSILFERAQEQAKDEFDGLLNDAFDCVGSREWLKNMIQRLAKGHVDQQIIPDSTDIE